MIENTLYEQELQRIEILFHEGWSLSRIAYKCLNEGRYCAPTEITIRNYLHRRGLWPKGSKRQMSDKARSEIYYLPTS